MAQRVCGHRALTQAPSPPILSQVWRDDRLVFARERAAGAYGTAAYFTAVVLFDFLPLRCGCISVNLGGSVNNYLVCVHSCASLPSCPRLLPPLLFSSIAYPMIGLRPGLHYWLQNLLVRGVSEQSDLQHHSGTLAYGCPQSNSSASHILLHPPPP